MLPSLLARSTVMSFYQAYAAYWSSKFEQPLTRETPSATHSSVLLWLCPPLCLLQETPDH